MADYTIKRLEDVRDALGDYPGEMRMMTGDLDAEQVAFTYRRMPQHTGGKGSTAIATRSRRRSTSWRRGSCSSS